VKGGETGRGWYLREGDEGRPEATTPARSSHPGGGLGLWATRWGGAGFGCDERRGALASRRPETERSRAAFIIGYCLRAAA